MCIRDRYRKSNAPDPDTAMGLAPWTEWRLRRQSQKPAVQVSDKQAKITTLLKYDANVELTETREPRGEIEMGITPDGAVYGAWGGTYYDSKKDNFDGGGKFEGKIYPGKIYRDEKGEDPSKLFFLAKGRYSIIQTITENNKVRVLAGDMYVSGWLNPDFSIASDITLTSDEKYSQVFHWQVSRPITE